MLDNLSFHRADEVKETCKLNDVTLIYNGTYSSQFMPVEMVWNFAKRLWRQEVPKIENFKNKTDLRRRIERCIMRVPASYLLIHVESTKRLM